MRSRPGRGQDGGSPDCGDVYHGPLQSGGYLLYRSDAGRLSAGGSEPGLPGYDDHDRHLQHDRNRCFLSDCQESGG